MSIIIKNISGTLLNIAWGNKSSEYDLREANLSGANLRGADLRGADLRGADLRGADLSEADLRADLSGTDLSEANLIRADLRGASLSEANLREADLRGADLRGADLRGADLSEANLRGADMRGANLSEANLHYLGNDSRGYQYFLYFEDAPIVRAGCRSFTMAQARAHWGTAEKHADNPILRAEILGKLDAADRIIAARAAMALPTNPRPSRQGAAAEEAANNG